jgi:hypothetical protein
MEYDICLLCLDNIDIKDMIITSKCNCRIKLHLSCFELIKKNGMLCPVCRIKYTSTINTVSLYSQYFYILVLFILLAVYSIFFTFVILSGYLCASIIQIGYIIISCI